MESRILWRAEFGDAHAVPAEITALVEAGTLVDWSWHNDIAPSFVRAADADKQHDEVARLWVEHIDPTQRETGEECPRLWVTTADDDTIYEGDDVQAALAALLEAK